MLIQIYLYTNDVPSHKLVVTFCQCTWEELDYVVEEDEYDTFELINIKDTLHSIQFKRTVGNRHYYLSFNTYQAELGIELENITCSWDCPTYFRVIDMCIANRGNMKIYMDTNNRYMADDKSFLHLHPLAELL